MSDLLKRGMDWLARTRKASMSTLATYRRGASLSASILVTRSLVAYDVEDRDGSLVRMEVNNFTLTAADLSLGGTVTKPVSGDIITYEGRSYEVCRVGDRPEWRWADGAAVDLIVHTRER